MSRTYKDKPHSLRFDAYDKDRILTECWGYRLLPTTKNKKRKAVDTEDHWMSTPSWWTRLMMNRPARREAHLLEVAALKAQNLEEFDFPDKGYLPHQYYW